MDFIDLRSDTVSHPTPEMRKAMTKAKVGDDVYQEDPTVNRLQDEAAAMLGKEAGLFVASGTQGNLCALLAHCQRGDAIILGSSSHIFRSEQGGMAQLGGIIPHTVPVQPDGTLCLHEVAEAINEDDEHYPVTRLLALENTHNAAGGVAVSAEYTRQAGELARDRGLILHIDGARIFNAAAALQVDVKELAAPADSLTFCLSKGLSAPAGSVLVGAADFIRRARRARKVLGGGMRQAGILAAAGLIGLHRMTLRLHEDHENAMLLAEGLSEIPAVTVHSQATNFVFFSLADDAPLTHDEFAQVMRDRHRILISSYQTEKFIRLRTHYWIDRQAVDTIISAIRAVLT